jgi:hypothetical protein
LRGLEASLLVLSTAQLLNLLTRKSPPENYGKEDQTTVAAFLLWRGS